MRAVKAVGGPIKLNCAPKCESDICNVFTLGLYAYVLKFEAKMQLFQAELHTAHCAVSDLAERLGEHRASHRKVRRNVCKVFRRRPSASIRVAWLSMQNGWSLAR